MRVLSLLFFVSGFAALVYQVVWQRTLFAIYGINVESVTVVVTAFMLGLGLGSLAGGAVSKDPRRPVVLLFALVEGSIGLFGAVSLPLFRAVGQFTLALSPAMVAAVTFLLVLGPTMLMGSTLPLLVAHFTRRSKNVGRSVGFLYFINTLGSAFASVVSVLVLLPRLGQLHAVHTAAVLNLAAATTAFVLYRRGKREPTRAQAPEAETSAEPA
ncbi:MAG TPA: MFS transporter [Polyangiaceae bacterium]|nr:MFS transporter [Polyangiaceae bacterium]